MTAERQRFRDEAATCLQQNRPAGELVDCVASHFPDVEAFRENDDLVIKGGSCFMVVRRNGPDSFRITKNVAVPSTNAVDAGGGLERTLDELIDEISSLDQ